jgi:diaminohydroxyphosphoribosylaminopyrimidine deaminase/5-amino-6-(5-phosphoribosylamino)uracil reductase
MLSGAGLREAKPCGVEASLPILNARTRDPSPRWNDKTNMPASHSTDERFLRRALDLAREGVGLTSPNPYVGAVIVDQDGEIVGTGSHTYDGLKHAEILAIERAGEKARGATLYVNLEPCSHQGRTGPCVDAVIAAGMSRVVACIPDPNPLVSGRGLARLDKAGIAVTSGLLEEEARTVNESFAKYIRQHTPLITLKAAMTLDGKIAPPPRPASKVTALVVGGVTGGGITGGGVTGGGVTGGWITSELARAHVQELRHQQDAILVGVGTVVADNPLLTDRTGKPRRRRLLRVIVDSRLRLPLESQVVQTAQDDVLVVCSFAEEKRKQQLLDHGIRVEQIPTATADGRPAMAGIARRLGELEITSLLIEGGAMINWTALASGLVDKVFLYYAPKILAGAGSVPFAAGDGFPRMSDAAYVKSIRLHRFGEDFAVEGYLRDPYHD